MYVNSEKQRIPFAVASARENAQESTYQFNWCNEYEYEEKTIFQNDIKQWETIIDLLTRSVPDTDSALSLSQQYLHKAQESLSKLEYHGSGSMHNHYVWKIQKLEIMIDLLTRSVPFMTASY